MAIKINKMMFSHLRISDEILLKQLLREDNSRIKALDALVQYLLIGSDSQ